MGLKVGDVLVLMVPNYLDLAILFKAALYHGIAIAPVDWNFTLDQLKETFGRYKPRMVFCESVKAPDVQLTLNEVESDAYIITVDKGDYLCSFSEFLEKYGNDTLDDEFKATDFDSEKTIAIIIPSSGATGLSKGSVATHKNFAIALPYFWFRFTKFPTPITKAFLASPLQYLTAVMHFVAAPIFRYTRLQSSLPLSVDTVFNLINTHMPQYLIMSPTMMQLFIAPGNRERCDFTCFDTIIVGGSPVPPELITDFKEISPNTEMVNTYAITEQTCLGFNTDNPPPSSCGKAMGLFQYRLIDVETLEDILEPNVQGELWIKGPSIFKGYYNNPEATAQAFAEDGWFKTGDIFYRDENYNFFFVERYKIHQGTFALAKLV